MKTNKTTTSTAPAAGSEPKILICPECRRPAIEDHNSFRCDWCRRLWPKGFGHELYGPAPAAGSRRDRPILFSAPMVLAILAGRKTQTRRVCKRQPNPDSYAGNTRIRQNYPHHGETTWWSTDTAFPVLVDAVSCPYGATGDRLWVRETFQMHTTGAGIRVTYRADGLDAWIEPPETWCGIPDDNHWRPAIFMPRWASRITLEIAAVRVDRLNAIKEDDAQAEGAERGILLDGGDGFAEPCDAEEERDASYRQGFRYLWEFINGRGSWFSNPFVWVIEFQSVNTELSGGEEQR